MSFHFASALKKLVVVVAAALMSTVLVTVAPASAAATATINNAGDLVINSRSSRDSALVKRVGDTIQVQLRSGGFVTTRYFANQNLRRDVIINLRGGGGHASVIRIDIPRDLKINMGSGENQVTYEGVDIGRNTSVIDGSGDLKLNVTHSHMVGRATMSTGSGLTEVEITGNTWEGNFTLRTAASGQMSGYFDDNAFYGPFRLTSGNGNDQLSFDGAGQKFATTTIDLRGGDDHLTVEGIAQFGRTRIKGGAGADQISIYNAIMNSSYTIDLGSGDDIGYMENVLSRGRGTVSGGAGEDLLGVVDASGVSLRVLSVEGGYGY